MIPSLPLITPRHTHTLWYTPSTTNTTTTASFLQPDTSYSLHHGNVPPYPSPRRPATSTTRSELAAVQHSSQLLLQRKQNIRRFGSTWLRPPGVPKTYQAMTDEAAEREEQALEAMREARMMEEQEAAEELEMGIEGMDDGTDLVGERDLDEDVPEAEGFEGEEDDMGVGEDEDDEGGFGEGDVVGESDLLGGIEGEGEVRDLDGDVPEAGSYQHTDTEVEDESTDDGTDLGVSRPAQRTSVARSQGSSILLGSSVLGSSPGASRQSSGAYARRRNGREN